jgi:hypothetical protein
MTWLVSFSYEETLSHIPHSGSLQPCLGKSPMGAPEVKPEVSLTGAGRLTAFKDRHRSHVSHVLKIQSIKTLSVYARSGNPEACLPGIVFSSSQLGRRLEEALQTHQ